MMEQIHVCVNMQDVEKIEKIPGFKHLYEYFVKKENDKYTFLDQCEWGKLILDKTVIIFHIIPRFEERLCGKK